MNIFRVVSASTFLAALATTAFAGVTINKPSDSDSVSSPFSLSASAATCSSQSVSTMGYSLDSSSNTTVIHGQSIDAAINSASGSHTLHVKAWGENGSSCVSDVSIHVSTGTNSSGGDSIVPSNAITVSNLESLSGWQKEHDDGGPGSSSGSMYTVSSPSMHGSAREFVTQFSGGGDERYSVTYSDDTQAENFFYDVWVYVTSSSNNIGNIKMDTNQVMPDGKTVIFGVQCDGYTNHWAYTVNEGSASNPKPTWVSKSGTSCNPRSWSQYEWHHVQAYYSRDNSGYITYRSVWLDGAETSLNETVYGAFDLGWDAKINTQFQVDGYGSSGHSTVYADSMTVSRW